MTDHQNLPVVSPAHAEPLAGKTVLLVEDESCIAELLTSWLGRFGAQTLWANNGREGVRLLLANTDKVCVVIADLRLPDMNGDEMCTQLRIIKPRLPVLLSSGRYQSKAEEFLARGGPTCFIQKPYPLEDVLVKLQKLLAVG